MVVVSPLVAVYPLVVVTPFGGSVPLGGSEPLEEWGNTASCEEIPAKRFLRRDLVFLSRFRCAYYADCLIAILY